MAWIESHQSLGTHRKLLKFCRILQISKPQAVGHLHYLWWWALDNTPDGDLSDVSADDIADVMLWSGLPSDLRQALIESGFINEGTLTLHDWDDYAGKLVDRRVKNAQYQRSHRLKIKEEQSKQYVSNTSALRKGATVPNSTVPNSTNKEIYKEIFDHWNEQRVKVHRELKNGMVKAIDSVLKEYSVKEVKTAITNYAIIQKGSEYYFNYAWTLQDFLSRNKADNIERFLDLEVAKKNFLRDKTEARNGFGTNRQSARELPTTYTRPEDL